MGADKVLVAIAGIVVICAAWFLFEWISSRRGKR